MPNDNNIADDQWLDEAPKAKRGWPTLTLIIGMVLILILASGAGGDVQSGGQGAAYMTGRLIGGPLALAGIGWVIAYGVTYRHRGLGWRIGSFVAFFLMAAIGTLWAIGDRSIAMQEEADAITITNNRITEAAADGTIPGDLPTTSGSPFQRMQAAFANDHFAEMRRFEAAVEASGVQALLMMDGLTHGSAALDRCGQIAAAEQLALSHRGGMARHIAVARAVGERAVTAGDLSQTDLADMVLGMTEGEATPHDRIWTIQAETMRRSAAVCRTLAQRQWETSRDGQVMFRSAAAMNSVNGELGRIQALNAELMQIQTEGRTRNAAAAAAARAREPGR